MVERDLKILGKYIRVSLICYSLFIVIVVLDLGLCNFGDVDESFREESVIFKAFKPLGA
jgi:hypothetical protein